MTELLVGTKKGLFRLEGDAPDAFEITARAFAGQSVEYAMRDPRTGRYLASVTSWFYGPKIWVTDDPAGEWEQAAGVELPEDLPVGSFQRVRIVDALGPDLVGEPLVEASRPSRDGG